MSNMGSSTGSNYGNQTASASANFPVPRRTLQSFGSPKVPRTLQSFGSPKVPGRGSKVEALPEGATLLTPKKRRVYNLVCKMRKVLTMIENSMTEAEQEIYPTKKSADHGPLTKPQAPVHERLKNIDGRVTLYGDNIIWHHLAVYLQYNECKMANVECFTGGALRETLNEVFFTEEKDHRKYLAWQSEYSKKFSPGSEGMTYPPPSDGVYPYCVELNSRTGGYLELESFWTWCLTNCVGEVRIANRYFFFQDEEDATLFKLKL